MHFINIENDFHFEYECCEFVRHHDSYTTNMSILIPKNRILKNTKTILDKLISLGLDIIYRENVIREVCWDEDDEDDYDTFSGIEVEYIGKNAFLIMTLIRYSYWEPYYDIFVKAMQIQRYSKSISIFWDAFALAHFTNNHDYLGTFGCFYDSESLKSVKFGLTFDKIFNKYTDVRRVNPVFSTSSYNPNESIDTIYDLVWRQNKYKQALKLAKK